MTRRYQYRIIASPLVADLCAGDGLPHRGGRLALCLADQRNDTRPDHRPPLDPRPRGARTCGTPASASVEPLRSSIRVRRENIVFCLRDGVARGATLGVIPLRRIMSTVGRYVGAGRGVMLERGIAPSTAVREPLGILDHEAKAGHGTGYVDVIR